jgi:hypothetical protein
MPLSLTGPAQHNMRHKANIKMRPNKKKFQKNFSVKNTTFILYVIKLK